MAWNRPTSNAVDATSSSRPSGRGKMPRLRKGLLAGAVVVALGALYFWLFSGGEDAPKAKPDKERGRIKEVKHAAAPVFKEIVKPDSDLNDKKMLMEKIKAMKPEERLEFLFEEAKKNPINMNAPTNRAFATGTEQIMSWIFMTKLGDPPPPLPRISIRDEAHLAEILIANNPVLDSDSEKTARAKQAVEEAKKEAIKFIKEGGDVQEFFQYYRDQLVQAYHEYSDAQKSVMDMLKNGEDVDFCVDYMNKVNEKLTERGIEKKIEIPEVLLQKFSEINNNKHKEK